MLRALKKIGSTSNLIKRIWEHKNKVIAGFTAKYYRGCTTRKAIEKLVQTMETEYY
jgi:predicted GIY-YIG superfamily endonuclease